MRFATLLCIALGFIGNFTTQAHASESLGYLASAESGGRPNLRAVLALTNDEARVRRDWAAAAAPQIRTINRATAGEKISTVTVFEGCAADAAGACNVSAQFSLETPDRKRVEAGSGSLWSSKPLDGQLMLGAASATIPIAANWPEGKYVLLVTLTDKIAARSIELAAPFEVRH